MKKNKEKSSTNELTVEAIYDERESIAVEPIHASTFLDALSELEWTELRAIATRTGRTDKPLLRCGDCRDGVYARESWHGRRHFYHFAGDHSRCKWAGAVARNLRSIDAEKFHGQQEGVEHKLISRFVAEMLAFDPAAQAAGIFLRRYTKAADGEYAYPDVYTSQWQGGEAAFEIQLATTQMPVIIRREEFYRKAGIRLIWIVGYPGEDLKRRAFRDIYMRNGGQIFGVDADVLEAAREAKEPRFRLIRLLPGEMADGFSPYLHNEIVSPGQIEWGSVGDRALSKSMSYDAYLDHKISGNTALSDLRNRFYGGLESEDMSRVSAAWNEVVSLVGGSIWESLQAPYEDIRALGVLASLRTGRMLVASRIELTNLPHLVNSILLEPPFRRQWTHAFELLCRSKGMSDLLSRKSIHDKCIRNRQQQSGVPIDREVGPVFNVFFPEGAFHRLVLEDN